MFFIGQHICIYIVTAAPHFTGRILEMNPDSHSAPYSVRPTCTFVWSVHHMKGCPTSTEWGAEWDLGFISRWQHPEICLKVVWVYKQCFK